MFFPSGYLVLGLIMIWLFMAGGCRCGKRMGHRKATATAGLPEDSSRTAKSRQPAATVPDKAVAPGQIPPGTCRIVGKIVAVLPARDPDPQSPCGQAPCRALVRVQRVIGYGVAFEPTLAEGQEIKLYFTFTLMPTEKYFPELTHPLPGLQVNGLFEANITGPPETGNKQQGWFQVKKYNVL